MSSRDALERLRAIAGDPAPPMDPDALERIERRLARLTDDHETLVTPTARPQRRPMRHRLAVLGAAAAVVVAVVVAGPLLRDDRPELLAADGVVLWLPDGATRTASAGERLSDGTEILVADDGFAAFEGLQVPGGRTARVVGGKVVIAPEPDRPAPAQRPEAPGSPTTTPGPAGAGALERVDTGPPGPTDGQPPGPTPSIATIEPRPPVAPSTSTSTTAVRPPPDETRPAPTDPAVSTAERPTTTSTISPPTRPAETTASVPTRTSRTR